LAVIIAPTKRAKQFLDLSINAWVVITLIGQWFFPAMYLCCMYFQLSQVIQNWVI
jgi:hypothetical protein